MAYGIIAKAGTKYGHCKGECNHSDCKGLREMAKAVCKYCNKPIGYETKFCIEDDKSLVHFLCLLEYIDNMTEEKRKGNAK